jgi:hypothetical protein
MYALTVRGFVVNLEPKREAAGGAVLNGCGTSQDVIPVLKSTE